MSAAPDDEQMYRAYMEFFATAERRRRWSVFDDIPWEKLDERVCSTERALCAETFCGVEMYLPDYVAEGLNLARDCFGQAWFQANWAYEESKHALALREYLVRSGQRTAAQMREYERTILARRWRLPFAEPRQMTCYGALQEAATYLIYRKQLAAAEAAGDTVLAAIYRYVARDEAAHAGFYIKVIRLWLAQDRDGTLVDLQHVLTNFTMPAYDLVPDYDARIEVMRAVGIDRSAFFAEVVFPLMRRVGTDRRELAAAARRARAYEPRKEASQ